MLKVILFSPNGYVGSCIREKVMNQKDIELLEITRETNIDTIVGYYDVFVYSASVTSERKASAEQYINDNALCAVMMVEFCRKHQVKRIIYLSSDEIYGQLYAEKVTENVVMYSPNIYATTKYLAEKVIMESGISYYILRLPGIVGRRWGSCLVYRMMDAIGRNERIYLWNADKDFNNVADIEDVINFIMTLIYRKDYAEAEVFLLGNTEKIRMIDMVKYMREILHSHSEIICMGDSDGRYFTLDVEKAVRYGYWSKRLRQIIDELCQFR